MQIYRNTITQCTNPAREQKFILETGKSSKIKIEVEGLRTLIDFSDNNATHIILASSMKILLINPNTTSMITARALDAARSVASAGTVIEGVTGHFGAPIINSMTDNAIGTFCAIELAARHYRDYDAIVLAVSFDTGLHELREMLDIPVAGMSESAMREASRLGNRFALVSFGARTKPLYENLSVRYGKQPQLASVRCIENIAPSQMSDIDYLAECVVAELHEAVQYDNADVGVLCATAFTGLGEKMNIDIPVVDGITVAIQELEMSQNHPDILDALTSSDYPERKILGCVSDELNNLYMNFPAEKSTSLKN